MNAIEFIDNNVISKLTKLIHHETLSRQSANHAIDHYRRCSSSTGKGKRLDDCLHTTKRGPASGKKNLNSPSEWAKRRN